MSGREREITLLEEQRDALFAALLVAEEALATKASLRAPEQARVQAALETVRAAIEGMRAVYAQPAPPEPPSSSIDPDSEHRR